MIAAHPPFDEDAQQRARLVAVACGKPSTRNEGLMAIHAAMNSVSFRKQKDAHGLPGASAALPQMEETHRGPRRCDAAAGSDGSCDSSGGYSACAIARCRCAGVWPSGWTVVGERQLQQHQLF